MGSFLNRLVNWFFSAATVLVLMVLAYLGWYNYLLAGIFLVFGIILAFVSAFFMRGQVNVSSPFEAPLASRARTAYSIMTLLVSLLLFALAVLLLAGYMK